MKKLLVMSAFVLSSALSMGCGPKSPAAGCTDLCKAAGHTTGAADVRSNEVNCTCNGGTDSIADAACTQMCKDIGKTAGMTYSPTSGTKTACQCT